MTEVPADDERVQTRAELLPEEQAAGSDDPDAQAAAILADSDDRTERREETMRESHQTPQ
jgi:ubiquitin